MAPHSVLERGAHGSRCGSRLEVSQTPVLILLSSYNGARYIREQIESIRGQTFRNWRLLIRDDGSSDDTRSIVRKLSALDDRIELLGDTRSNVGPWASFGLLLSAASKTGAGYLLLSDQDDVWLPTKIEHQLEVLSAAEESQGASHPILVHSDLEVVGENLEPLHPSFREFQGFSHNSDDPLRTLLIHNGVVGCTVALNRALLDIALPSPHDSPHDWWLALCAAATGTVISIFEPTVKYRQHASNVIGARAKRGFVNRMLRHPLAFVSESLSGFGVGVRQSRDLAARMGKRGLVADRLLRVQRYAQAFESAPLRARVMSLRESGARPRRRLSRILIYCILLMYPRWGPDRGR